MKATATSDVDRAALARLRLSLRPDLELDIDQSVIEYRSAEPPSWIQFFAEAPWWVQALGACASLYAAKIVEEAAKDTWKNKTKIYSAAVASTNQIRRFAHSLFNLKAQIDARTKLVLGLPVPDDHFGVRYELIGHDEDLLAAEIALFVRYIPVIERLIETEGLKQGRVTGAIAMVFADDASLRVSWMDREHLRIEERTLRLDDEA